MSKSEVNYDNLFDISDDKELLELSLRIESQCATNNDDRSMLKRNNKTCVTASSSLITIDDDDDDNSNFSNTTADDHLLAAAFQAIENEENRHTQSAEYLKGYDSIVLPESDDEEIAYIIDDDESDDFLLAKTLQAIEHEENKEKPLNNHIESDFIYAKTLSNEMHKKVANDDIDDERIMVINGMNIVSPELEVIDPNPNIWRLFRQFDVMFFNGILCKNSVELSWSKHMTRTAGICAWNSLTKFCSIRLSEPLLQLRPRKDLVETLLHEMIHALLFVTHQDDNHESHGQIFHLNMFRINQSSGTNITVFHNFHDEVDYYLKHVWRCNGPCRDRPPFYGWVKRAMNRAPGPSDRWYLYHSMTCGGKFVKVEEPAKQPKAPTKRKAPPPPLTPEKLKNKDIRDYGNSQKLPPIMSFEGIGKRLGSLDSFLNPSQSVVKESDSSHVFESQNKSHNKSKVKDKKYVPFSGIGHVLGGKKLKSPLPKLKKIIDSKFKTKNKEENHNFKEYYVIE